MEMVLLSHSYLLPSLGFKVGTVVHTGNDVHLGLTAVHLCFQVPFLTDDPTAVEASLLEQFPDSCVHVILSLLKLAFGKSPRGGCRVPLHKNTLQGRKYNPLFTSFEIKFEG